MLFGNSKLANSLLNAILTEGALSTMGQCSILVYKNTIPTDQAALSFDPATRSADLLGTFTNSTFSVTGNAISLKQPPSAITTPVAGTVTWAYIKGANSVGFIVDVGLAGSYSPLILDKLVCTAGGSLTVVEAGMSLVF